MKTIKFLIVLTMICILAIICLIISREINKKEPFTEYEIKVIFISGKAHLEKIQKELKIGDIIPYGDTIKVDDESICYLQILVSDIIKLSAKANMQILETEQTTELHLKTGKMEYKAANFPDTDIANERQLQITTVHGELINIAEHFFLETNENNTMLSVYKGETIISTGNIQAKIHDNQGVAIAKDKFITQPVELPDRPKIIIPENDDQIEKLIMNVECESINGAAKYLWQFSANENFSYIVKEEEIIDATGKVKLPQKNGKYYLRNKAINSIGLIGLPSDAVIIYFAQIKD